ncbi:hypothetical protein RRG08_017474 [Elysia crispata]|uniref:Uncharacterized protein n=1 Tax=Elysia crispata TaxID=231223 RepID=A0AAE0YHT5_9GAST|nr:hypothetical protein RRG08_017474 [Elysia crispata]
MVSRTKESRIVSTWPHRLVYRSPYSPEFSPHRFVSRAMTGEGTVESPLLSYCQMEALRELVFSEFCYHSEGTSSAYDEVTISLLERKAKSWQIS